MSADAMKGGSTVIPAMRYEDAHAAIDWLVKVLGFEVKALYDGPGGTVEHAALTLGRGMIMLGSVKPEAERGEWSMQPDGPETQSPYVIIADTRAAAARVEATGGKMLRPLEEMSYGGWAFTCRDPGGHVWSVGEYDPWI